FLPNVPDRVDDDRSIGSSLLIRQSPQLKLPPILDELNHVDWHHDHVICRGLDQIPNLLGKTAIETKMDRRFIFLITQDTGLIARPVPSLYLISRKDFALD